LVFFFFFGCSRPFLNYFHRSTIVFCALSPLIFFSPGPCWRKTDRPASFWCVPFWQSSDLRIKTLKGPPPRSVDPLSGPPNQFPIRPKWGKASADPYFDAQLFLRFAFRGSLFLFVFLTISRNLRWYRRFPFWLQAEPDTGTACPFPLFVGGYFDSFVIKSRIWVLISPVRRAGLQSYFLKPPPPPPYFSHCPPEGLYFFPPLFLNAVFPLYIWGLAGRPAPRSRWLASPFLLFYPGLQ